MTVSKAQQRATAKYVKNTYDRIEVKAPKGTREKIKSAADKKGESINKFLNRIISDAVNK